MLIIGHRGAKGLAPENTKASFQAALKAKADLIEFDIRTSYDKKLVIVHDPVINKRAVAKTSYEELKKTDPQLLTFHEVINIVDGKRPLLVEIKPGANVQVVIAELKKTDLPKGSWLGSFDFTILKALRTAFPDVELLVIHKWSGIIARRRAIALGTRKIAINNLWLYKTYVRMIARSDFQLIAYTINNVARADAWEKVGLFGCVTDFPDRLNTK